MWNVTLRYSSCIKMEKKQKTNTKQRHPQGRLGFKQFPKCPQSRSSVADVRTSQMKPSHGVLGYSRQTLCQQALTGWLDLTRPWIKVMETGGLAMVVFPSASTRKTRSHVKCQTNAAHGFSQDRFCHLPPMLRWEGRKSFSSQEAAEEALTTLMFCIVLINPTEKPTRAFSSTAQDCCSEGCVCVCVCVWVKYAGREKSLLTLCSLSGGAQSDNACACRAFVRLAFCGLVYVTLQIIHVSKLCNISWYCNIISPLLCDTEMSLPLCLSGVCTSITGQQYEFYHLTRAIS